MSATESGATTAAKGDIADPAKIKADNAAAAAAPANGSSNGDVKANGDSANGNGSKAADQEEPVAGPSKSPSKNPVDVVKEAMGYYTAGKRDLLIRDPASAVASLAQACQLLGSHYGETAAECGEPYYYYGRALLDLARMEAGVIDNVLDGVPDEEDSADDSMVGDPEKCTDEEKEKVGKDVDKALEENYESCEKMKAEKEAKDKSVNGEAEKSNGDKKADDKTDGNCVAKPEVNGKHSPNGKEASPAAKDKDVKASPAAKEAKASPAAKDAKDKEAKASPAAKDKEAKSSPVAKDAKASPATKDKEAKASPAAKESKSSPAAKESKASPAAKDKEVKSSPASKDAKPSPKGAKVSPAANGKDAEMTSPKNGANGAKTASLEGKKGATAEVNVDEEMEVEVSSKKEENGHSKEAKLVNGTNGKKESEEDGDSKDGEDEEEAEGEAEAEGQEEEKEGAEENKENEGEEEKDDSIQGDEAEKGDVAATEKEDEDEPSNLQLAWEMLELAKNILVKQADTLTDNKEKKAAVDSRICDTFQTLGELSIENENYPQAIEDLGTCLQRRKEMLPEDSRLIAETHYQLGVAQGFNLDFDRAVDSLNEAISVLAKRVDNLKAKTESVDPAKKNDAFYTREGEVKEIESLIPEIKEKIADTNDMKAETQKKLAETRLSLGLAAGAEEEISTKSSTDASTSKVSTISTNLIKKRKKSDEGENGSAESEGKDPAKKPHIEDAAAAESTKEEDKKQ